MGGLKVLPEITIDELNIESNDLFNFARGNTWTSIGHEKILEKVGVDKNPIITWVD
ncbi:hypothetical protein [Clostridioides difficile]|uniref:hypothetical protein n=1 Tax=Clostridioides difficile TaxID=1496 RepID=UPI002FD6C1C8